MTKRSKLVVGLGVAALFTTTACGASGSGGEETVPVAIGYQSKTINTVTAGTLMRELGLLEKHLDEASQESGLEYDLSWHDFASGPPLTAEMIAGKVHIGSMGDYPLSVNGAKTAGMADVKTRWVSVTGFNLNGSLNQIVVPKDSDATTLHDLEGEVVSTSLGSTAHGNLVSALDTADLGPDDVEILGQDPPVGVTALESGQVAALAQFVPFPQRVIFSGEGRLLHDGNTGVPTFHGVVAAEEYTDEHPEVLEAFLAAQDEATRYIHEHPLKAAEMVAEETGLPPEVVYLYNGPNGAVTFDLTLKPDLIEAVEAGLPFLKDLGALEELDVEAFVDEEPLRELYGDEYDAKTSSLVNASALSGHDDVCDVEVDDPATASEAWPEGADATEIAATPECLLRRVVEGGEYRALYVPDTASGTRIFAEHATWVRDTAAGDRMTLLPFGAFADAESYADDRPSAEVIDFQTALDGV